MWATQGCLQPFEFANLSEEDRQKLGSDLQKFLTSTANPSTAFERAATAGSE